MKGSGFTLVSLALGLGVVAAGMAHAAADRLGYVDVQKVLVRSGAGIAARDELEKEKAGMQKQVDARRDEMEKLRDELTKKGLLLSPDARKEKEETIERKIRDLRRLAEDLEKELQRKEQAMTQRLLQEIGGVVERYGKEKAYLVIFEKRGAGVIYGDGEADVTEDIIKLYDQERTKKK
jgi:outer membrane protein